MHVIDCLCKLVCQACADLMECLCGHMTRWVNVTMPLGPLLFSNDLLECTSLCIDDRLLLLMSGLKRLAMQDWAMQ